MMRTYQVSPAQVPPSFLPLEKLHPGDSVAILSTSAQLVSEYPATYELGLTRLRELFKLVPVEFPATRATGSSLEERARDIMSAFAAPKIKGVIAVIGGGEQIKLLPFLDPEILRKNPKPFFGFSDNTNLGMYLWSLGIPSYYGGSVMTEYAMSGDLDPFTEHYLRLSLFERHKVAVSASAECSDQDLPWADPGNLRRQYEYEKNEGLFWDGTQKTKGILWGGCLEIIGMQLQTGKWLPSPAAVAGGILCLETSEEMPSEWMVFSVLHGLGERGYLEGSAGLIVGRPKARNSSYFEPSAADRQRYRETQRQVILKEFRDYNKIAPVVQNFDFGHTRPQIPMPMGQEAEIDPGGRTVVLQF